MVYRSLIIQTDKNIIYEHVKPERKKILKIGKNNFKNGKNNKKYK